MAQIEAPNEVTQKKEKNKWKQEKLLRQNLMHVHSLHRHNGNTRGQKKRGHCLRLGWLTQKRPQDFENLKSIAVKSNNPER
jgi:hypothetical protein